MKLTKMEQIISEAPISGYEVSYVVNTREEVFYFTYMKSPTVFWNLHMWDLLSQEWVATKGYTIGFTRSLGDLNNRVKQLKKINALTKLVHEMELEAIEDAEISDLNFIDDDINWDKR